MSSNNIVIVNDRVCDDTVVNGKDFFNRHRKTNEILYVHKCYDGIILLNVFE